MCGFLAIAFELLTLTSFILIFIRRRSKKALRESRRYSTFLRSSTGLTDPSNRPRYLPPSTPRGDREEEGYWIYVRGKSGDSKSPAPEYVEEMY